MEGIKIAPRQLVGKQSLPKNESKSSSFEVELEDIRFLELMIGFGERKYSSSIQVSKEKENLSYHSSLTVGSRSRGGKE